MNKIGNKLLLILLGVIIGLAIMVPFVPFTSSSNQYDQYNNAEQMSAAVPNIDWQSKSIMNWQRVISL